MTKTPALPLSAGPAQTYAQAVERISGLEPSQRSRMNQEAVVRVLTHGAGIERVIVLIHGYTSCPVQFHALGDAFFERGYNVLIAPLPHHGFADRSSTEHASLKSEELTAYTERVLDVAAGLGRHRTVAGLSAGGLLAAWAAQFRPDVDLAVPIAPSFGYRAIATRLTRPVAVLLRWLPNFFTWWHPQSESDPRSRYMYPTFASHALAQLMKLGFAISSAAEQKPPAAKRILMVLNGNEPTVNNELSRQVVASWRRRSAEVTLYEFDGALALPHDLIDPAHPQANFLAVHPILIDLISGRARPEIVRES